MTPFDHEVRKVGHYETVFDGSGLALIRVTHHVLFSTFYFANNIPFNACGEACAPHSTKSGILESGNNTFPVTRLEKTLQRTVLRSVPIRVSRELDRLVFEQRDRQIDSGKLGLNVIVGQLSGDVAKDPFVQSKSGRKIALPEAGSAMNFDGPLAHAGGISALSR